MKPQDRIFKTEALTLSKLSGGIIPICRKLKLLYALIEHLKPVSGKRRAVVGNGKIPAGFIFLGTDVNLPGRKDFLFRVMKAMLETIFN